MLDYDLHCHSNISDGTLAPAELVDRAAGRGVKVMALTDHDDVDGLDEARAAAARHDESPYGVTNGRLPALHKAPCVDGPPLARVFWSVCPAGRSCHVSGLFARPFTSPLAIMLSADQVPTNNTRSDGAWRIMGCPDPWADWHGCVIRSLPFPTSVCGLSTAASLLPQAAKGRSGR